MVRPTPNLLKFEVKPGFPGFVQLAACPSGNVMGPWCCFCIIDGSGKSFPRVCLMRVLGNNPLSPPQHLSPKEPCVGYPRSVHTAPKPREKGAEAQPDPPDGDAELPNHLICNNYNTITARLPLSPLNTPFCTSRIFLVNDKGDGLSDFKRWIATSHSNFS